MYSRESIHSQLLKGLEVAISGDSSPSANWFAVVQALVLSGSSDFGMTFLTSMSFYVQIRTWRMISYTFRNSKQPCFRSAVITPMESPFLSLSSNSFTSICFQDFIVTPFTKPYLCRCHNSTRQPRCLGTGAAKPVKMIYLSRRNVIYPRHYRHFRALGQGTTHMGFLCSDAYEWVYEAITLILPCGLHSRLPKGLQGTLWPVLQGKVVMELEHLHSMVRYPRMQESGW